MKFSEIVDAAVELLERKGRVSYRALAREFDLDDDALADLAGELIDAEQVARDENGKVLVWRERPALQPTAEPSRREEGERRQLTVMFCDLVGSTELSGQLDPEELHELVTTYQDACRGVIARYEGYIAQYLGDGILAYFGYPQAHEDDAVRAVQAGLDILTAVNDLVTVPRVQVRIGVHTGPVVIGAVGEGARVEQLALGETPNIAARVQGAAAKQTIAISEHTFRLVQGMFSFNDLGVHDLKGLAQPLRLHEVTGAGDARSRFEVSLQRGLTPLVGRDAQLEELLQSWQQARRGHGRGVMLSGDAGIGKSRLTRALAQQAGSDVLRVVFKASPFYRNTAFYSVIEQLERLQERGDDDAARLERLEEFLAICEMSDPETVQLFAYLLEIPLPDDHPQTDMDAQTRKSKTLKALALWLQRRSEMQPVQAVFEDLHWADPSTLELLQQMLDTVDSTHLLIVMTFRPEFVPPWSSSADCLTMELSRLSAAEIEAVATRIAGKRLPPEVLEQLVQKTDGVPLFVEEMTRDLLDSDLLREADDVFELTRSLPNMGVPFSLQDSLAARLDRLGPVRRLAQIGAVLGRDFEVELLRQVADVDGDEIDIGLDTLCDGGILFRNGPTTYTFKHALLQDAAYNSLLNKRRQQTHAEVARLIEAGDSIQRPELLAYHYTEAGLFAEAVPLWRQAGEQAVESSANREAIAHLTKALETLKRLPESPDRDRTELALHLALGVPLTVTTSWAAPEVREAYDRALELAEVLGESEQLFPVLYGVWSSYQVRGDYRTATPVSRELLSLAEQSGDENFLLQAHRAAGINCVHTGAFAEAITHCDAGLAIYRQERHHRQVSMFWIDPGVGCLCYGAWSLWCLGYPDRSVDYAARALRLARESGHAFSIAYALHFNAVMHQCRRDGPLTEKFASELLEVVEEKGFPVFKGWGMLLLGCALAEQGRAADGSALIREGEDTTRSAGSGVAKAGALAALAGVYERARETRLGYDTVAEAVDFIEASEERFYEAEIYRVRGELHLHAQENNPASEERALADFERSISIARQQQARSWELRATLSLARLLIRRGQQEQAALRLAAVYDGFSEGFETQDLIDARELLETLGRSQAG